jgi:hypothetical protein
LGVGRGIVWAFQRSALAADQSGKPSELVFFLALAVSVGRPLGELMQRVGQPAVISLLGGLL